MVVTLVLAVSVLLQFSAALLALRLIRVTGRRTAWALIATAVFLMAVRRSITLFRLLSGDLIQPPDLTAELVALAISALMVAGIARIAPLFHAVRQSEEMPQENEQNFRDLVENLLDGVAIVDENAYHIYVNPRFAEITGYSVDELLSMTGWDFTRPEDVPKLKQIMRKRMADEPHVREYERVIIRKDGTEAATKMSTTTTVWQGKRRPLAIIRDVTERVQAEIEIRQKTKDLALINTLNHAVNRGDSTPQIVELLCQETRRIFSCNGATLYLLSEDKEHLIVQNLALPQALVSRLEKLAGVQIPGTRIPLKSASWYQKALQVGKPQMTHDPAVIQKMMAECTPNKTLKRLIPRIYKLLSYGSVMSVPLVSDGEAVGLLDMARQEPFTDSDLARFEAIAGQLTALLKHRRAEEAFERVSRQNELILNSAGEGIYGLDAQENVTFVNPAAARMLGWEAEEIGGQLRHEVMHHSKGDGTPYPRQECPVHATVRDGVVRHVEDEVFWRKDGTSFPVEYVSTPIREGDELVGAVVTFKDITERLQAQEALRRSLENTARGHRMLLALSQAAQAVQRARTPDQVYQTICETVGGLGYNATVLTLTDDRAHLAISHLTLKPGLLQTAEKLTGLSAKSYRISLEPGGFLERIVAGGKTTFTKLDIEPIAQSLPRLARPLAGRLATLLNWEQSIVAPLTVGGEVQGLLAITGSGLSEADMPAVSTFANQAAIAVENARLYEETNRLRVFNEGIVQSMTEGIVVEDAEGTFTFINPAAAATLGYEPEELLGQHWTVVVPPDQQPIVRAADERRARGETDRYEMELARKDGTRFPVLISGNPRFEEDRFVGTLAVFTDITERVQAEEALRESEQRYRTIFDGVLDAILVESLSGEILGVNERACEMYGYPRDELLTKTVADLVPPEHFALIPDESPGSVVSDQPIETVNVRASGEQFPVEITGQLQTIGGDTVLLVVVRDVTERRQAEGERERLLAQIQEQAQQVQQIIATVPEGVLLLDRAGRVVLANPLGKKDLATLADAQVGDTLTRLGDRSLAELLTSPPKGLWHEVMADGLHFEIIARPLDIELESEELALSMAEEWVLVIRDVTQEREMQQRVQRQERLAAVGQLAGGIAHDFNNLLTTIMLYAQMPLTKGKPDLPPNVTRSFEIILDESWRAAELVQQILDFSRRSPIQTSPMDLGLFVQKTLRVLERTIPENINLRFTVGPEEYVVSADPTRIQQVLMNLATNGRDAMPEGGEMRFELSRVQVQPGEEPPVAEMGSGEWVCLAVSDTGTGIPPEALARIFEPFFTTKEPGKGTGLGLAQVHGIVALHGGHIGVETEAGKGTTFRVYLRASGAEEVADEGVSAAPEGKGETILLVEDNEKLRAGGQTLLESLGYRVLTAANGREALEVFEQHADEIALVVTDLVMPEMGGKMLFRKLREMAPDLKVLAITGYTVDEDVQELKEAGFLDVAHKPFDVGVLAQIIRRALDER